MAACWKPGRSHRKPTRKTAESRTLGASMAGARRRLPQRRRQGAGAAEWLDSGRGPAPGADSERAEPGRSHTNPGPATPPPAPSRAGEREGGAGAEGRRGRWRGRRCGPRGARRGGAGGGRSAPAGRARGCGRCAQGGPGAPGRGRRARPPRSRESGGIRSARGPLAPSEAGPSAAPRGSRSPPAASALPGACGPGGGSRRRAPGDSPGWAPRSPRRARCGPRPLPSSAPASGPAGRSPQGPALGQRSLAARQAQGPAPDGPVPAARTALPRRGVCFRPSRSGKGHSLESGRMLQAAAPSPRPRPLVCKSPGSPDAGRGRRSSPPLRGPVRRRRTPIPLAPSASALPPPQARSAPRPVPARRSASALPARSAPRPPRGRHLPAGGPSLCSAFFPNLFLFSPASPHHEFPLSVPRLPGLPARPLCAPGRGRAPTPASARPRTGVPRAFAGCSAAPNHKRLASHVPAALRGWPCDFYFHRFFF